MSSSPNQWYVQTDFGALLGPMPVDALAEMARTGALLRRDLLREGSDGVWKSASAWPSLFDETAPPPEPVRHPESSLPHESFKIASSARLLDDLMNPEKSEDSQRPTKTTVKRAKEMDFEVDAPLLAPAPTLEVSTQQVQPIPPAAPSEPVLDSEPPKIDRTRGWDPPTPVPIRHFPTARSRSPKPRLWKRSLPLAAAVAVVLLFVTAWWVWPRQRPDIYSQFVAIYKELQQRRENAQDQSAWDEFASRANAQLNDVIPWLEDRAKPGDREKSLLLYAGRDLQALLEQPRDSKQTDPKRLNAFFEQLQEMYGEAN